MKSQRGDTLVEVLLATVVISAVLAGAYTLSNKASSINQSSYDRTRAAALAQKQAELIRAARDSYTPSGGAAQLWNSVKAKDRGASVPDLGTQCDDLSTLFSQRGTANVFFINDANSFVNNPIPVQDTLFTVWNEVQSGPNDEYWDIHTFVCWPGVGQNQAQKMKLVLRLEEERG
jgi:type II secretory pathway pseudopilin PulG